MMLHFILALVAATQLAMAFPTDKAPMAMVKTILDTQFCVMPEEFVVKNFQVWTPDAGNNRSAIINFNYSDDDTHIDTKCQFNETSVNVGPEGLTPRYACDNKLVEFIWENGTLTMVERDCPLETLNRPYEVAGTITPMLTCLASAQNSTMGAGNSCWSRPKVMAAVFISLEPTPN
ncbi:hypothetical protein C8A00DRAFT_10757 [Chaetomidium leptoderma]|uniref:AA1-like domain-containing protein n=1 Tax=Chaetomidium leptoderma TaxID=669021 RepID=A0AAN7A1Y3_9PEZI|nr:hypothetical protein C8A00DRAFT_10757 [Chaetomidium leptoderma]